MSSAIEAGRIVAESGATGRNRARDRTAIRAWLHVVALMIVAMVVVGGATRLTDSGLSITEWKPIHGVVPPLNATEWQEEFTKYKQIPEYTIVNPGMTLDEFQTIFWWEWAHRLLGRLIGVVVFLPLVFFGATGRLERKLKPKMVAIFLLGGLQGAVGWWMVASGLTERVDVSQYRLTAHLTLACIILAYVVWVARSIAPTSRPSTDSLRATGGVLVALVFVQIFLGGLVAGLDAGLVFNTWPLMDGRIVPAAFFVNDPWWLSPFESIATVQFDHRIGAYALFAVALFHAWQARGTANARSALLIAGLVTLQAAIGIETLIRAVPLSLGLLHQFGAVVVLWAAVAHWRAMSPPLAVVG